MLMTVITNRKSNTSNKIFTQTTFLFSRYRGNSIDKLVFLKETMCFLCSTK